MRILIPTIGSRGDVQPFIALAQGLERAGHTATLASHPIMRALVESYGVTFAPIGPDIDLAQEVAALRLRSRNPAVGLVRGMRFGLGLVEQSHADILALCQKVDLASQCVEDDVDIWGLRGQLQSLVKIFIGPFPVTHRQGRETYPAKADWHKYTVPQLLESLQP